LSKVVLGTTTFAQKKLLMYNVIVKRTLTPDFTKTSGNKQVAYRWTYWRWKLWYAI